MHRDHVLQLHGQRFHYTEWGEPSAPPVLLLHGVTGHARTWDGEARALAERYRVLALDQRGHGDSDPAPDGDYSTDSLVGDVAAFADALALPPVRLVGLSLGGRVAIAFAARHAAAVERLVVIDIGPELPPACCDDGVWIDPLVWAREIQKEEKGHKLGDVCARLGVPLETAHRANFDAEAAGRVLLALATGMPERYGDLLRVQQRYAATQDVEITWRRRPYILDHIFYNDWLRPLDWKVVPTPASDHHALWAEFEFAR